ncbi:MAG: VOC family protein [Thermodesulfobacteriota bacterium]
MKLNHIGVVCRSAVSGDRFYKDLLGLEKRRERRVPGVMIESIFNINREALIIDYGNDRLFLEVFVIPDLEERRPVSHLCLEVTDRPAFLEKCQAMGFPVRKIAKNDGTAIVFIQDDDGNQYEIKETA